MARDRNRRVCARPYCAIPAVEDSLDPTCPAPALAPVGLALLDVIEGGGDPLGVIERSITATSANGGHPVDLANLRSAQAVAAVTLGQCYLGAADPERALPYYRHSIDLTEAGASDVIYADALRSAARCAAETGDWSSCARYTRATLTYADHTGDLRSVYGGYIEAVAVLSDAGRHTAVVALESYCHAVSVDTITVGQSTRARSDAVARAAVALSPDEFEAAQKQGAAMSGEEAFELATSELDALTELED